MKLNIFYNLERPSPSRGNSNLSKKQISPEAGSPFGASIPPERIDQVARGTRDDLAELKNRQTPKYTPEESAEEKARILLVLERVGFDDAIQSYAQAVINNKYVPKEIIQSGMRVMGSEIKIMMEIMQNGARMTVEDQKAVAFAMMGGENVLRNMLRALPETVIEIPANPEGTEVKKISGMTLMSWMPEPLKKLAQ